MVVCHCLAVNDRRIRDEIVSGALDADQVAQRCGAGAGCGGCWALIEQLVADTAVTVRPGTSVAA